LVIRAKERGGATLETRLEERKRESERRQMRKAEPGGLCLDAPRPEPRKLRKYK
jgi:hypothetical protein